MKRRVSECVAGAALVLLLGCGMLACGSGNDPGSANVIEVDGSPITRATIGHWMPVITAGDNLEHVGRPAPKGLVSDPFDGRACKAAIESIGPPKATPAASVAGKRVGLQCRQLYDGIKEQTAVFLIQTMWAAKEAAQLGVEVSDREVSQGLAKTRAEYKTDAAYKAFMVENGRSAADERFLIERNLRAERLEAQRRLVLRRTIKDERALGRALLKGYVESVKKWSARTRCSHGYVVEGCKTYRQPTAVTPSPAVILEQLAASRQAKSGH